MAEADTDTIQIPQQQSYAPLSAMTDSKVLSVRQSDALDKSAFSFTVSESALPFFGCAKKHYLLRFSVMYFSYFSTSIESFSNYLMLNLLCITFVGNGSSKKG
jgi:hypothetical protein